MGTLTAVPVQVVSCNDGGGGISLIVETRSGERTLRQLGSALFTPYRTGPSRVRIPALGRD